MHTGTHAARLLSQQQQAVASTAPNFSAQTMFAWSEPTSPHITAVKEGKQARGSVCNANALSLPVAWKWVIVASNQALAPSAAGHCVTDTQLQHAVQQALAAFGQECGSRGTKGIALAETAGGPASPAPSGSLQVMLPTSSLHSYSCWIQYNHSLHVCLSVWMPGM